MTDHQDHPEREETATRVPNLRESISRLTSAVTEVQQHIERRILNEMPGLEKPAEEASRLTGASFFEVLTLLHKLAKEKETP